MKKFSVLVFFEGCHAPQKTQGDKKWISLFNGKDINDWMVKIFSRTSLLLNEAGNNGVTGEGLVARKNKYQEQPLTQYCQNRTDG